MAGRDKESQAVMAAAMRYVKSGDRSELDVYSLASLQKADYQLGNRDVGSGYRRAIADRISELEAKTAEGREYAPADIVDVKPNFFGLGINFNEAWRRVRQRWKKR